MHQRSLEATRNICQRIFMVSKNQPTKSDIEWIAWAGRPGNVTIDNHIHSPPVFYIFKRQLWYMKNESAIWPVNMKNTTGTHILPAQLIIEEKRGGIAGTWRWEGTMLNFDIGGKKNPVHRLFFVCRSPRNIFNVFWSPQPWVPLKWSKVEAIAECLLRMGAPTDCEITTLHSFINEEKD